MHNSACTHRWFLFRIYNLQHKIFLLLEELCFFFRIELCLLFPLKIAYVSADHKHYWSLHTRLIHIGRLFVTGTGPFSHPAVPGWAHKRGLNWVPATVANCHLMPVQFRNLRSANLKHEETKLNTKYAKSCHCLSINSNFCSFLVRSCTCFPNGYKNVLYPLQ